MEDIDRLELSEWLIKNCHFTGNPPDSFESWKHYFESAILAKCISGLKIEKI